MYIKITFSFYFLRSMFGLIKFDEPANQKIKAIIIKASFKRTIR